MTRRRRKSEPGPEAQPERGKRGPRKGDGGRRQLRLYNDPDRWIIIIALWLRDDPGEQRSATTLEAFDLLLSPHDGIELELGTRMVDGVEFVQLSLTNTQPMRSDGPNNLPDHLPRAAPGGQTYRRSRLDALRAKVSFYQRKTLTRFEEKFYTPALMALDMIAGGRPEVADPLLRMVKWEMNEVARARLATLLNAAKNARLLL
jgi:hypothetical protein